MKFALLLSLLLPSLVWASKPERSLEASEMWFRKRLSLSFEVPVITGLRVRPSVEIRTKLKSSNEENQKERELSILK